MPSRKQIQAGLDEIGACWCLRTDKFVDPDDDYDAKPTYHIHPDKHFPHQNHIIRFKSLELLWSWIQASRRAIALTNETDGVYGVFWLGDCYDAEEL